MVSSKSFGRSGRGAWVLALILVLSGLALVSPGLVQPGWAAGPTYVSAHIKTDQTWSPSGSPYVITQAIQVQTGATLTILPGTVVKFTSGTDTGSPYNYNRISVYGGRLMARGTASAPIVFTSTHDDTGGDVDGDGRAPEPGDWSALHFSAPAASADAMPVSVLERVSIRYAGEGGSQFCSAGASVGVADTGRLHLARSEIVDSYAGGVNVGAVSTSSGSALVSQLRIADSGCGFWLQGGDFVNSVVEESVRQTGWMNTPTDLGFYGNWLMGPNTYPLELGNVAGTGREAADIAGNALLRGVNGRSSGETKSDLRWNWWGESPSLPGGCYDGSPPSMTLTVGAAPCSAEYPYYNVAYRDLVEPFSEQPPMPPVGPEAPEWVPPGVPAEQVLGLGGSEYAYRPVGLMADPVNSATGSFVEKIEDAAVPAPGLPLLVDRTYNSADETAGWLGRGWSSGLQARLEESSGGAVTLVAEDGQRVTFQPAPEGGYATPPGGTATLTSRAEGGWTLETRGGLTRVFGPGGLLRSTQDRNGNARQYSYDTDGRLIEVANGSRAITVAHVGTTKRISSLTLPDGRTVQYGYTDGLLTAVTSPGGAQTRYGYDATGRLTSITDPAGEVTMRIAYDPTTGRVSDQWDALGNRTQYAWDPSTQTATMTDPKDGVWTDRYVDNVIVARTTAEGATTNYEYDQHLRLLVTDGPRGVRNSFDYNAAGDLVRFIGPGSTVSTGYNADHQPVWSSNGRGVRTEYRYDTRGNLTELELGTNATPATLKYGYDERGLRTSSTDARGKTTTYGHNTSGDLTRVTTPMGHLTTFGYDTAGRQTSRTDPRGHEPGQDPAAYTTTFTLTDDDQLAAVTDALGHVSTFDYDTNRRLKAATDPKNRVTRYTYDTAGHVLTVKSPEPDVPALTYTYDANGNTATVTDTMGRATSYTYDQENRPTTVTTPLGATRYVYDKSGNPIQVTDPAGLVTKISYNGANRITKLDYPTGTTDVTFRYDANGNRTKMVDAAGTVTYTYDQADRLLTATRGTKAFGYRYDPAGGLTRLTYPDGTVLQRSYDDDHRLHDVTDATGTPSVLASYTYDAAGNLRTLERGNATVARYDYDPLGQLAGLEDGTGANPTAFLGETYEYDPTGNLTSTLDTVAGQRTTHTYDLLDRLTATCYHPTEVSLGDLLQGVVGSCDGATDYIRWTYDAAGNRTSETRPSGTSTYTREASTGLLTSSTTPETGTTDYTYTSNGQLKTDTTGGVTTTYAYNAQGRLTSASNGTASTTMAYDGDGRRLSATGGGATTNYTWEPQSYQLALETTGDGTLIRRHRHGAGPLTYSGPDGPDAVANYLHTDRQGSVRAVTDPAGNQHWTHSWEPYGTTRQQVAHTADPLPSSLGWLGEYAEPDTHPGLDGQVHLRARQYHPSTGGFSTPDPIAAVPYSATYGYANANPLRYADPSGLAPEWLTDPIDTGLSIWAPTAIGQAATHSVFAAADAYNACTGDGKGTCADQVAHAGIATALGLTLRGKAAKNGDMVDVWRTVGADEAADIAKTGRYRVPAGGEGKYFFPSREQAENLGRMYSKKSWAGPQTLTRGRVPRSVIGRSESLNPAGEGPAWFIRSGDVSSICGVTCIGPIR